MKVNIIKSLVNHKKKKPAKFFLTVLVSFFFLLIFTLIAPASASAATYYWVGGTTNSNTNNAANWKTSAGVCADSANLIVPGSGDSIQFVSNCTNNATVNANLSVTTFLMNDGYTGTVTVSGTSLTVATTLTVNRGNLSITNGGSVTAPPGSGSFIIGSSATSNGTITVSGSGSQLTQTIVGDTRLRIGNTSGAIGNLIIQNGATATTGTIQAAYGTGTTANITIDGAGSVWNSDNTGGLGCIGRAGTASLTISNGAVINSAATPWQIGGLAGSVGTVEVTGSGSQLNMTGSGGSSCNLRVGYSGTGTLTVSDGAIVNVSGTTGKITVADQASSTGTLNIGTGYTMDQITTTLGVFTGSGTAALPPIPPSSLTNTAVTQTSIDWNWNDVTGAAGYKVYSDSDSLLATISTATSNWNQTSLSLLTPYTVYVRSSNAQGVGYASSDASVTTLGEWLNPSLTLNNSPESRDNNQLRLKGTVSTNSQYRTSSVQYSINGGGFSNATATDGSFDEVNEEYYFDFNPTDNQPKDSNGNLIEGYTIQVKAIDSNTGITDKLLYFSPFNLQNPTDESYVSTSYPNFEFTVNKQRENLRDNLSKYQIQVQKIGEVTSSWETLINDVPIDFRSVKNNSDNKQRESYGGSDTNNGVYETDKFFATYSDDSSRIRVYSKINSLSGAYRWKVVAVDKAGHTQEAGSRKLYINQRTTSNDFPLAVLNITGLGNPNLNTYNSSKVKDLYFTSTTTPTFYGIAWSNSKVTLILTDQDCKSDCIKTYEATANTDSRFDIKIPKANINYGKKYIAKFSVALDEKYNELPQFTLSIGKSASIAKKTQDENEKNESINKEEDAPSPSSNAPSSTPMETKSQQENNKKRCFWFLCL
jgi:T5SS/PEP-CTERM-associated repeat protein